MFPKNCILIPLTYSKVEFGQFPTIDMSRCDKLPFLGRVNYENCFKVDHKCQRETKCLERNFEINSNITHLCL